MPKENATGITHIQIRFKQFLVRLGIQSLQILKTVITHTTRVLFTIFGKPTIFIWILVLKPALLLLYKPYVVLRARAKRFFHAQHTLLALLTHRYTVHTLIIGVCSIVLATNVAQAQAVRAEDFAEGSLVSQIFQPDLQETVITASNIQTTSSRYVDTSTSLRVFTITNGDTDAFIAADDTTAISEAGALVKSNVLNSSDAVETTTVEKYTVQGGDTLSTIAQKFGISTNTILWTNDLHAKSVIKPGQELLILPTSGVAHTVASGETLESIAEEYKASVDNIIEYNGLIGKNDIPEGVEIIIPDGKKDVPQAPAPAPAPAPSTSYIASTPSYSSGGSAGASAAVTGGGNWPASCRRISQYYGYRHSGLDIDCNFGDPIYAFREGRITTNWGGGYGLQVLINHPDGTVTRYAHLQKVFVSNGDWVGQGQHLGEMGSTGRSTGSHLHFEVIVGGRTVNPFSYF